MARTGRPELPENARRTERIYVYLTSEELDVLKGRAAAFGVSVSELARRAITGIKLAVPVSAENVTRWRDVGRIGANLNQSTRALNGISKRLALLDEPELEGVEGMTPVTGQELLEAAKENARLVAEITEVMTDIRALLMDQWRGNVEEARARGRGASGEEAGS